MEFKDYYKILGVDTDAGSAQIKTAYRKLARKYHPDVSEQHGAEEKFKEVAEAYEVLKDPEKRAEYDEIRRYGQHGQSFQPPPGWQSGAAQSRAQASDFSEFFSAIFGRDFEAPPQGEHRSGSAHFHRRAGSSAQDFSQRGQDVETDLPVFLEDTLNGCSKTINYELGGSNKTLQVKVPAGIANMERIRLKGQGGPGYGTANNGDLYLRVRLVPHPLYDVEGHNLVLSLPLAPWEAALGTKVEVPTLHGAVNLSIPADSQSGQRLRIAGKGLLTKGGQHGDLFAVIKIVNPPAGNVAHKEQWQQLAALAGFDPRAEWRSSQ